MQIQRNSCHSAFAITLGSSFVAACGGGTSTGIGTTAAMSDPTAALESSAVRGRRPWKDTPCHRHGSNDLDDKRDHHDEYGILPTSSTAIVAAAAAPIESSNVPASATTRRTRPSGTLAIPRTRFTAGSMRGHQYHARTLCAGQDEPTCRRSAHSGLLQVRRYGVGRWTAGSLVLLERCCRGNDTDNDDYSPGAIHSTTTPAPSTTGVHCRVCRTQCRRQ